MGKTVQNGKLNRLRKKVTCGVLGCLLAVGAILMPGMEMTAQAYNYVIVNGIRYRTNDITNECEVMPDGLDKTLEEIHIPATIEVNGQTYRVTTIEDDAFDRYGNLKKVIMEEGLKTINHGAFSHTSIEEIEIPASVTDVNYPFEYCYSLKKIRFLGMTPPGRIIPGVNYDITIEIPEGADVDKWKNVLKSYDPDNFNKFTIQTYTPSSGSNSTSSSAKQGSGGVSVEASEEEPVNRIPEHVCQYEWETVREAGAGQDGLEQYLCRLCGSVQSTLTIPAAQYQVQELYTKVTAAAEGETVTYDMGQLHTVCDKLFTKLQERGDITLVLTYRYKGADHRTTFPAGADYTELMADEEQFYGMPGLNGRCGIVTE